MRKYLIAILTIGIIFIGGWQFSKTPNYQLFGSLINRVDTADRVVALTFDDGPKPKNTKRILDILSAHDTKATFFLVGDVIRKNSSAAESIVAMGHEIGNHSYSHKRMVFKSLDFVSREIEETTKLIRQIGYSGEIHFRPPYGKKLFMLPYYLDQEGIKSITWDVAPEDELPRSASAEDIARYVSDSVKPGSIILLHVMFASRENSLAAVPLIIEQLKAEGYRFVTVSELLGYENT